MTFQRFAKLVDVGGAHGAMTLAIAKRYPSIRCTCVDLPTAELGAIRTFETAGLRIVPPLYLRRLQSRLRGLFCRLIEPVFEMRVA